MPSGSQRGRFVPANLTRIRSTFASRRHSVLTGTRQSGTMRSRNVAVNLNSYRSRQRDGEELVYSAQLFVVRTASSQPVSSSITGWLSCSCVQKEEKQRRSRSENVVLSFHYQNFILAIWTPHCHNVDLGQFAQALLWILPYMYPHTSISQFCRPGCQCYH